MCVVCGCSNTGPTPTDPNLAVHPTTGDLHFGAGAAKVSVPGMSQARAIKLEADVLGANNAIAAQNRVHFASHNVTAYNLVSSPGSGKTTLLCATIEALKKRNPDVAVAVIEGDQQTAVPAAQVKAIDTNGAGDMFAGAFLFAVTHGHSHVQAAVLANQAAGQVVSQYGNRLTPEQLQAIRREFEAEVTA